MKKGIFGLDAAWRKRSLTISHYEASQEFQMKCDILWGGFKHHSNQDSTILHEPFS